MAIWAHAKVLTDGIAYIKANCDKIVAIKTYSPGDSYAIVTGAGNILAEAALTSSDLIISASGADQKLTSAAGKQDLSANAGGVVTQIGFLNSSGSEVLWVTDETSGQTVVMGNPVVFPSLTYTSVQPVQA